MDLQSKQRHLWGQQVNVRGTIYDVGKAGLTKDVAQEHAELLLQNREGWRPVRSPVKAPTPPASVPPKEEPVVEEPAEEAPKSKRRRKKRGEK